MVLEPEVHVVCEDLFKIYKITDLEVVALRGLDLKVNRGEIIAIVGASGSGKTTLLNILAGYDTPSAGSVIVGQRDLLKMSPGEVIEYRRREVGFIWQQTSRNLLPYLTTLENVELPMLITSLPRKERAQRARDLLSLVGMGHRLDHTPEKLSGGEQQRTSIAVALANSPRLLLADEPTGELDSQTADEVLDVFDGVNRELGTSIIIVTHDSNISRKVARVVTIRDGKTSTEVLRKVSYQRNIQAREQEEVLEEFSIVDAKGRVQIPREILDSLKIKDRARFRLEDGKVVLVPEEEEQP